jgi:hypothetical protein
MRIAKEIMHRFFKYLKGRLGYMTIDKSWDKETKKMVSTEELRARDRWDAEQMATFWEVNLKGYVKDVRRCYKELDRIVDFHWNDELCNGIKRKVLTYKAGEYSEPFEFELIKQEGRIYISWAEEDGAT